MYVTPEAKRWSVHELAKRAGVSNDFFARWDIECNDDQTIIHLDRFSGKQICFAALRAHEWRDICAGRHHTCRAAWMRPQEELRGLVPDFVVPYCHASSPDACPLFELAAVNTVCSRLDLPASILFNLCRLEDLNISTRDIHGRVAAKDAVAFREGFLHRPIVDEYGFAFEQALRCVLPRWRPEQRTFRVKLSHDIDEVGTLFDEWPRCIPLNMRSLVRLLWMASPARFRSLVQAATRGRMRPGRIRAALFGKPPIELIRTLASLSFEYKLDSAFYWKAGCVSPYDSGYDPRRPRIRTVISELQSLGFENGVHPGYETYLSPERLREEVETVRAATGECVLGGRQHYLRWSQQTWIDWEECGLRYDSTLAYADCCGFRAGTCIPYHPWIMSQNRESRLLEIPLIIMDVTLSDYMKLTLEQSFAIVDDCINRCRSVGGVFTFLCHNDTIRDEAFLQFYTRVLKLLCGAERFDSNSIAQQIASPIRN